MTSRRGVVWDKRPEVRRRSTLAGLCAWLLVSSPACGWIGRPAAAAEPENKPAVEATVPQPVEAVPPEHARLMAAGLEIFRKDVRPLLSTRCLDCHSSASTTEGGFDLSTREGLLRGGKSGKVVVPGRSKESRLMRLVAHLEKPHMPKDEEKLSDKEIARLAEWIDCFAPYDGAFGEEDGPVKSWTEREPGEKARQFWSFQPLRRAAVPEVSDSSRVRTPADNFVMSRLEEKGIAPSAEVDRRLLIRRASFDLLGLPPDPAEVEAFLNDPAPDAYERLIDRLLASPHYGERWGRHWLDLARFAESHGFEHDYDRETAYHYRDFVIQALNDDLPYDTFVKWQLAGDELAPNENLAMMATGFLAAGVHSTQITKNEVEKHRYDELDDMLATTGTAMLGLTIGCARCHDHKFDPIPQGDYYRLLSAFTTTVRSEVELNFDKEGFRRAKEAFDRAHAPIAEALARFEKEQLPARFAEWEKSRGASDLPDWIDLEPVEFKSSGGATFEKQDDGSFLVKGEAAERDTWTFVARTGPGKISALRIETLTHHALPHQGPGRADDGNFALADIKLTAAPNGATGKPASVPLRDPQATFAQDGAPASAAVDGDGKSSWSIHPQVARSHAAVFAVGPADGIDGDATLTITLKFETQGAQPGRVRLSVASTTPAPALDAVGAPAEVAALLSTPADQRTPEQSARLVSWYRRVDSEWLALHRRAEDHLAQAPKPDLRKVLVSSEGLPAIRLHSQGEDFFPETFYLRRGDPNQKEGAAPVGFLQVMMRAPDGPNHWPVDPPTNARTSFRRTALANWITDVDQGAGSLLARVIVNRLWQHHLGRGIVATSSDFGSRGEAPTHPELLDWLASELVARGWRLKPIHKMILTSSVYRQSAALRDDAASIDPDNLLYWRYARRRLEGEVIRDAILAASGMLEQRLYGPGTLDEGHTRRSIYFTVKRSQLAPMMQVFDAPDALSGVGERPSTTIAPQALMLLNNPGIRDWSRAFARRLLSAGEASPREVVRSGYLVALGREPSEAETADALAFLARQQASYAGESSAANDTDGREAALTDFCQILLCLNEFIYVE